MKMIFLKMVTKDKGEEGSFVERQELFGWKEKQWNNGKSK